MLNALSAYPGLTRQPETFSEYVTQQIGLGLLRGGPLRPDIEELAPQWLARLMKCEEMRAAARSERGLHAPSVLFMAITGRCNLRCRHCYTQGYAKEDMDLALARRILSEAHDLGVGVVVVSGGEPLLHPGFFEIVRDMPDMPFVSFTNGTYMPEFLDAGLESPNTLWLVSIDGPQPWNDARRGEGTFDVALSAMEALRARGLFFGFSATLSGDNVAAAMSSDFVSSLFARGCRCAFFLGQVPTPPTDPSLCDQIDEGLARCRQEFDVPIIGFPADEGRFGGCKAGGNGVAHVSVDGHLEPCPAARLAADSLSEVSLETALRNPFFAEFRDLKERFSHEHGSCTYSGHEETFEEALARYGARPTV